MNSHPLTSEGSASAEQTPGPWSVCRLSRRDQPRPFYVCRDISPRPALTHFEQLRAADGSTTFATETEATAVIAKSLGGAA